MCENDQAARYTEYGQAGKVYEGRMSYVAFGPSKRANLVLQS
jgi:hypothetical protein